MPFTTPFRSHLYFRIWLAVVGGVMVLTVAYGWAWRYAAEQNAPLPMPPPRELIVRNAAGDIISSGTAKPRAPGDGMEFSVALSDGETLQLEIPPRERRRPSAFWLRPPYGFFWMLGLVSVAVAVGLYPIVRKLTQRLVALQRSVQQFGEGDLTARSPVTGQDEVADLSRRFNAAAGRIETLVHSHKSLLANASHELRSPLTRIRMGMELMGPQASPTFRDEILRNIAELDQLVDEILLASRLDASEADVGTVEEIDLVGLAAEESIRVDADLEVGSEAVAVRGVAKLLRRAIRNLLENARRYSRGPITIDVRRQGGRAVLRVNDRGTGVPLAQRERIFEPFYRLPGASEREGGVGLGLALVRSIAERHHGSIRCEARADGPGASFVLELPLDAPA